MRSLLGPDIITKTLNFKLKMYAEASSRVTCEQWDRMF